jgi:hypothetical protein
VKPTCYCTISCYCCIIVNVVYCCSYIIRSAPGWVIILTHDEHAYFWCEQQLRACHRSRNASTRVTRRYRARFIPDHYHANYTPVDKPARISFYAEQSARQCLLLDVENRQYWTRMTRTSSRHSSQSAVMMPSTSPHPPHLVK